jgi:uncharacterized damage-inducible protein DinB
MSIGDLLLRELQIEAKSTRAMLERVPAGQLEWTPHEKSMSLGKLAWHLASIPRIPARIFAAGTFEISNARPASGVTDYSDFLNELERNLVTARETISQLDDAALFTTIDLKRDGAVVMALPKYFVLRNVLLNHTVHHRGQLSVYLRLLNIPLPATYGTSADEVA